MMNRLIRCAALAGVLSLGACEEALEVTNPNDPETERVLATPKDAEALLGSYYRRWLQGFHDGLGNVWGMSTTQSFENYSSLANNCMNARSGIPRPTNNNDISNACSGEQQEVYFIMNEVARVASNILQRFNQPGYTLNNETADHRARAFAEFLRGVSLGYVAMVYDSSAVVVPGQDSEDPGPLLAYMEVMDSSLSALSNAISHAQAADDAGGTEIPEAWIPSTTTIEMPEFIQLIRTYRARFRANVARNPAERAAVDWAAVIADAQNGITADHEVITDQQAGPVNDWVDQFHTYGLWHQMPPFIIGFGDTTGSYAAWIALPLDDRGTGGAFFMVTPDQRFPQGDSRAAQQADFAVTSCDNVAPCERYFRNRPSGNDQGAGVQWGQSNYDFVKFHPWAVGAGGEGAFPFFTVAELNMLEAEGHIRASNFAAAAALINLTRTTNGGLPAVTGTADGGLSGNACVPKRANNAAASGGGTVTCGDLMEAMKWEKRIETLETHPMAWFLDSRGWGDLPEGTPTHWAPPYQDLQARRALIYSIGMNTTGGGAAGPSTYGW
jgi:hypothetical protein